MTGVQTCALPIYLNNEDADFEDEVDELPAPSVQELPHIKDCAGQLATIARGSLFPDKVVATCILEVAKAAVTLPTPDNHSISFALKVDPTMPECVLSTIEGAINLTEHVNHKLLKE